MTKQSTLSPYQSTVSQKTGTYSSYKYHEGFTEVYPGIFVGKKYDVDEVLNKVDILIPLDSVGGDIWKDGYTGDIMYIPVTDYSVLPKEIESIMVNKVLAKIVAGKKVAIFCIGGHGRTGYFTSLLLGRLGIEDPIKYIRDNYCTSAVETNSQVSSIAEFLEHPEWKEEYKMIGYSKSSYSWGNYEHEDYGYYYGDYGRTSYYNDKSKQKIGFKADEKEDKEVNVAYCEDCTYFSLHNIKTGAGFCYKYDSTTNGCDACLECE